MKSGIPIGILWFPPRSLLKIFVVVSKTFTIEGHSNTFRLNHCWVKSTFIKRPKAKVWFGAAQGGTNHNLWFITYVDYKLTRPHCQYIGSQMNWTMTIFLRDLSQMGLFRMAKMQFCIATMLVLWFWSWSDWHWLWSSWIYRQSLDSLCTSQHNQWRLFWMEFRSLSLQQLFSLK